MILTEIYHEDKVSFEQGNPINLHDIKLFNNEREALRRVPRTHRTSGYCVHCCDSAASNLTEGCMAKISYGRSVKPVAKNNARARRHMRRMLEAIACRKIEEILASELGWEPPARATELCRAENHCRRAVTDRVSKAVETETEYHKQIMAGAAKYPDYRMNSQFTKVCNEAGRQIHAVQKKCRFGNN